jgi:hypothetical protein
MPFHRDKHQYFDVKEWEALNHFHQKWNVIDGRAREAAAILGYSQEDWDTGKITHLLEDKDWTDLDAPQRDAASLLGFTQEKWHCIYSSIHTHSHHPHADPNDPDTPVVQPENDE